MKYFKYMGRVLTERDEDWPKGTGNLRKDRKRWGRMARILSQEGGEPKVLGIFSKAVVQAVLVLGEETWVLNPRTERALRIFHNRVAQQLTDSQTRQRGEESW